MKPIRPPLIITLLLFATSHLTATEIGLWHSSANPDWKPFETEYGWAVTIQQPISLNWFGRIHHYDTSFTASGPEVGRVRVTQWREYGIGYGLDNLLGGLYVYATYTDVDAVNESFDGPGIHLGYSARWSRDFSGFIQVGQIDTGFFDVQLEAQLNYHLTENLQLAIGLRDHHDWDMTNYHVGIKWQF